MTGLTINDAKMYYTQIDKWGIFSFGAGGGGSNISLYLGDLVKLWRLQDFQIDIPGEDNPAYIVSAGYWIADGHCIFCKTVSSSNPLPTDKSHICNKQWKKVRDCRHKDME